MIERVLLEEGRLYTLIGVRKRPGEPTTYDEFVSNFTPAEQRKLDRAVRRLADRGLPGNTQKGRALRGYANLSGIKESGLRVFWFETGERTETGRRIIVLTHGFRKKSHRTPVREIERTEGLKTEYFATFRAQ